MARSVRDKVEEVHRQHPDWNAREIAEHLGVPVFHADGARIARRLPIPKEGRRSQYAAAVARVHIEHPEWTSNEIADFMQIKLHFVYHARRRLKLAIPKAAPRKYVPGSVRAPRRTVTAWRPDEHGILCREVITA